MAFFEKKEVILFGRRKKRVFLQTVLRKLLNKSKDKNILQ